MNPIQIFNFIKSHKGKLVGLTIEKDFERLRDMKQRRNFYRYEELHNSCTMARKKAKNMANRLEKVFIPAMMQKIEMQMEAK